jgi:predicted RNA binding protein YcfA (HicA-like mRNA interferase family)
MAPKLPVVTPRKLIQALERSGFVVAKQRGSHVFLNRLNDPSKIIAVPFHNKDLKKGTLKSILRQAGLEIDDLIDML